MKKIFTDCNALKLVLCFGLIFGTVNTYGTVIGIMIKPLGYTDNDSSLFGAIFIFGGIIGSGALGAFVEITKKYKFALLIICIWSMIAPLLLAVCLWTKVIWIVCVAVFILGVELAILPIGIDMGVELTFPVAESISTGLLMSCSQVVTIITTYGCDYFLETIDGPKGSYIAQGVLLVTGIVGFASNFFVKEDLKRVKFEKSKQVSAPVSSMSHLTCQETSNDIDNSLKEEMLSDTMQSGDKP